MQEEDTVEETPEIAGILSLLGGDLLGNGFGARRKFQYGGSERRRKKRGTLVANFSAAVLHEICTQKQ